MNRISLILFGGRGRASTRPGVDHGVGAGIHLRAPESAGPSIIDTAVCYTPPVWPTPSTYLAVIPPLSSYTSCEFSLRRPRSATGRLRKSGSLRVRKTPKETLSRRLLPSDACWQSTYTREAVGRVYIQHSQVAWQKAPGEPLLQ